MKHHKVYQQLIFLGCLMIILISLLVFVRIDKNLVITSTYLNHHYYLYLEDADQPVYYLLNHQVFRLEKLQEVSPKIYLVEKSFEPNVSVIFYQIEKKISLMSYLLDSLFKI